VKTPRVLFICHNHPAFHPGGTEIFAYDLFRSMRDEFDVDTMFLGCADRLHRDRRPGTLFQTVGRSADEMVMWSGHFDRFNLSQIDLHAVVPEFTDLLRLYKPDIVHFHHVLMVGVEALFLVRRSLPRARIVMTLHDYFPICAHEGQMVTAGDMALCERATPDACHRCFPDVDSDKFVLRRGQIQAMFGLVDQFLAPSEFLRRRYVEWGLPADKIMVMRNARPSVEPAPPRALDAGGRRDAFGFFGNLNPFKGVPVAIDAALRLVRQGDTRFTLSLHGGMPFQTPEFKDKVESAARKSAGTVVLRGAYKAQDLRALFAAVDWVVVPSVWWENAPLVIQEAFQHRRPVICSDIGGMAEAVRHDVDGLHFRVGDAVDLSRTMRRAMDEPGLWQRLSDGIAPVPTIDECAEQHLALYESLLSAQRRLCA
jgi:glycosyltransferase involved in cell wall biosynthesis